MQTVWAVPVAWVVVLAAVASVASAAASPAPGSTSPALGVVTDAVTVPAGSAVRAVPPGVELRLGLTLPYANSLRLSQLLSSIESPRSPEFRQFLTASEFDREFLPTASAFRTVERALESAGATDVTVPPGSATVTALVTGSTLERLFGVRPVEYGTVGGAEQYTTVGQFRLTTSLEGAVTGVDGLSGAVRSDTGSVPSSGLAVRAVAPVSQFVRDGSGGPEWFVGSDYAQAYEATALWPGGSASVPYATYPSRVAIATLLTSGYNSSNSKVLPPYDPSVVSKYFSETLASGWPAPTIYGVPVAEPNGTPPVPGPFYGETDSTGSEIENSLDLEMAGSLAPGASIYNFYFSGALLSNPETPLASVAGYFADDLFAALNYSYGASDLAVVSCSFGTTDLNNSEWDAGLAKAAAMGVTVVAASGDQANAPAAASGRGVGAAPLWPATAAYNDSGAVSVGGVSLSLSGNATSTYTSPPLVTGYDAGVQGIGSMSAWFDTSGGPGNISGSEGGVSSAYAEPYWQFHSAAQPAIVTAAGVQGAPALGRAGPDVALPANSTIAFVSADASGTVYFGVVAGTSVAAPVFAGLVADVVAVETSTVGRFAPLGYLDPEIYRLASYFAANPGPGNPFYDVANGSNALFQATTGWNAVTGWGGVIAPLFLAADESPSERNYTYVGPTPTYTPPASGGGSTVWTLIIVVTGAGTAAAVGVIIYANGRSRRTREDAWDPALFGLPAVTPPTGAPPAPPVATFACPYCGAERPAEAVPCPSCGLR